MRPEKAHIALAPRPGSVFGSGFVSGLRPASHLDGGGALGEIAVEALQKCVSMIMSLSAVVAAALRFPISLLDICCTGCY